MIIDFEKTYSKEEIRSERTCEICDTDYELDNNNLTSGLSCNTCYYSILFYDKDQYRSWMIDYIFFSKLDYKIDLYLEKEGLSYQPQAGPDYMRFTPTISFPTTISSAINYMQSKYSALLLLK